MTMNGFEARSKTRLDLAPGNLATISASWFVTLQALIALVAATAHAEQPQRIYHCQPAQTYFCRNIHVSCAGVTDIPAAPFTVSIAGAVAAVEFEGAAATKSGSVAGEHDLVVRLSDGRDWIRIEANGRYSHRIHAARGAAMSQGRCVPAPAG